VTMAFISVLHAYFARYSDISVAVAFLRCTLPSSVTPVVGGVCDHSDGREAVFAIFLAIELGVLTYLVDGRYSLYCPSDAFDVLTFTFAAPHYSLCYCGGGIVSRLTVMVMGRGLTFPSHSRITRRLPLLTTP